jgi:hypothetical protein
LAAVASLSASSAVVAAAVFPAAWRLTGADRGTVAAAATTDVLPAALLWAPPLLAGLPLVDGGGGGSCRADLALVVTPILVLAATPLFASPFSAAPVAVLLAAVFAAAVTLGFAALTAVGLLPAAAASGLPPMPFVFLTLVGLLLLLAAFAGLLLAAAAGFFFVSFSSSSAVFT